jgi:hypothetical protein
VADQEPKYIEACRLSQGAQRRNDVFIVHMSMIVDLWTDNKSILTARIPRRPTSGREPGLIR